MDKYKWYNLLNSKTIHELKTLREHYSKSPIDESAWIQKIDIVLSNRC